MYVGGTISQTGCLDIGKQVKGKVQRMSTLSYCILPAMRWWKSSTTCFWQHNTLSKPWTKWLRISSFEVVYVRHFWHCGEKIQPTQSPSSSHEVYSSITIFFSLKNLMSIEVVHMYTWMRFFILTKRNTQFQVEHMIHREIKLI